VTASRSAREKKAAAEAGPLAKVKIDLDRDEKFVYKISCTVCVVRGHLNWSAYRPGGDNGFIAAMDRWVFHLNEKHPGTDAPCLAFLSAAQERLHERRHWQDVRAAASMNDDQAGEAAEQTSSRTPGRDARHRDGDGDSVGPAAAADLLPGRHEGSAGR
jgi:hypothetical protein